MKPKKKVFLSYAHEDTRFAEKLASELNAAGIDVFIDRSILRSGDLIHEVLLTTVMQADAFIILWSKNSKDSNYVKLELNLAFGQRANNPDYRIIAILRDETPPHVTIQPFFNIEMKHGYDSSKVEKIIDDIKKIKIAKEKSDKISITERLHGATPTKEVDLSRYENALLSLRRRIFEKDIYSESKINIRQQYYDKAYAILKKSKPDVLFAEEDSHKNHFVNRDEILRNIRNKGTRFVNIFGPSGYGKTYLLNALLCNFNLENKEEVHWISAMIDASLLEINSPESVCKELISAIDPNNEYDKYDLDSLVRTIMTWVEKEIEKENKIDQVLFLIDNFEAENTQLLDWLLGDDSPIGANCRKIFNNYENAPEVRLIIASRHEIKTTSYSKIPLLDYFQLNRLNASDISQLLSEKLKSNSQIKFDRIKTESLAAKIFRVTGGHPRSIGYICDKIIANFKGYEEFDSSYYLTEGVLPIILYEVLDQVELGYQYVLWILSSFHFFDIDMLIQLKQKNLIRKSDDERINEMNDLVFLLKPLINSSLITNVASGRPVHVMEPALQNVLSKWMQQEAEETYREINYIICNFFDSLFGKPKKFATATKSTSARLPNYTKDFYYFIESLYQFADFSRFNEKPIQETLLEKIDIFVKFLFERWHKYSYDWVTLKTEFLDLWNKQEDLKDYMVIITGNNEIWADLTNRLDKTL